MNKILKKYIGLLALPLFLVVACEDDDNTGNSPLTPSSPTVTITIPQSSITLLERDSTFKFTVTLSEPQIVDVVVYINVVGGTATLGEDFSVDNSSSRVLIPAYRTSGTASISVNADAIAEENETFKIQFGDGRTANASITPSTVEFTIINLASSDFPLALSWNGELFDAAGDEIAPTDIANLALYVTAPNGTTTTFNTDGFEGFALTADSPDGEYLLRARVESVIDVGQLGTLPVLDLALDYSQYGVTPETTLEFPASFSLENVCAAYYYTLAKIIKSGNTYEVVRVGEESPIKDISFLAGAYTANEPGYGDYDVNFAAGSNTDAIVIDNFWDSGVKISYVADFCEDGAINIPAQSFGTYTVTGSGTYEADGSEIVVHYTVVTTATGAVVDDNTHTFTRK